MFLLTLYIIILFIWIQLHIYFAQVQEEWVLSSLQVMLFDVIWQFPPYLLLEPPAGQWHKLPFPPGEDVQLPWLRAVYDFVLFH